MTVSEWFHQNTWAVVLAGLLLIGLLYIQGGPWGALGTLGIVAVALIVLVRIGQRGGI